MSLMIFLEVQVQVSQVRLRYFSFLKLYYQISKWPKLDLQCVTVLYNNSLVPRPSTYCAIKIQTFGFF